MRNSYLTIFFSTEKTLTDSPFSKSSQHLSGINFPAYCLTHKGLVGTVPLLVRTPALYPQCNQHTT